MRDATLYTLAGNYIAEPHLAGKRRAFKIERVEIHEFDKRASTGSKKPKKVKKMVLYFVGVEMPFGLTAKVNAVQCISLFGRDLDKWAGRNVWLEPSTCEAFGDPKKPCVRVGDTEPNDSDLAKKSAATEQKQQGEQT